MSIRATQFGYTRLIGLFSIFLGLVLLLIYPDIVKRFPSDSNVSDPLILAMAIVVLGGLGLCGFRIASLILSIGYCLLGVSMAVGSVGTVPMPAVLINEFCSLLLIAPLIMVFVDLLNRHRESK